MTTLHRSSLARALGRVRRHPGPLAALLGYRVGAALLLAGPLAAAIGAAMAGFPEGDRLLFANGGELAIEVVRLHGATLLAAAQSSLRLSLVLGWIGLWPLALLLESWRGRRRDPARLLAASLRRWPSLALLAGATLLTQALCLTAGLALSPVARTLASELGELGADLAGFVPLTLAGLAAAGCALLAELARVLVVAERLGWLTALTRASARFGAEPFALLTPWALSRALDLTLVALGALATSALAPGRPEAWRLGAVTLLHLGLVAASVCLRALWLAWALERLAPRAVRPWPRSPADRAGHSDGPGDPSSCPAA